MGKATELRCTLKKRCHDIRNEIEAERDTRPVPG